MDKIQQFENNKAQDRNPDLISLLKSLSEAFFPTLKNCKQYGKPEEVFIANFISEENQILVYDTLIFFVSQSLENNKAYHVSLLANYLPKLYAKITKESISKLIPYNRLMR